MRISYSALGTFTQCPAKFKFSNIDKIKAPKSKEAVFGTLIHDVLKMLHEPTRLKPPTEEEVLKYFTSNWKADIYSDKNEEAIRFQEGVGILKNYYAANYPTKFTIVDLETRFEVPIKESGTNDFHLITGKIDRIDKISEGGFELIDYKTSRKLPTQKHVDQDLQLSVYHLGMANRWPSLEEKKSRVKLSLYFLKHQIKLSTSRTAEQLEETKQKVLGIIGQIKKSDFPPIPNPLCAWCEYQPYCPMYMHKFKKKESIKDEQINEVVKEYFQIKERGKKDTERLAQLAEIINQYCDEQKIERVFSDIGYITRILQERYQYDEEKIKELLAPIGKWDQVLSFDNTKLKKILEVLPRDIKEEIEKTKNVKRFKMLNTKKIA